MSANILPPHAADKDATNCAQARGGDTFEAAGVRAIHNVDACGLSDFSKITRTSCNDDVCNSILLSCMLRRMHTQLDYADLRHWVSVG